MPRTRSPPFSPCLRPAPEGWHAHANPQRHKPGTVLPHDTGSAASGLPAIPLTGVPAGPWPARWEVVLRLRASAGCTQLVVRQD
jgi:hypothetical protein